jgi:hypothetical protein
MNDEYFENNNVYPRNSSNNVRMYMPQQTLNLQAPGPAAKGPVVAPASNNNTSRDPEKIDVNTLRDFVLDEILKMLQQIKSKIVNYILAIVGMVVCAFALLFLIESQFRLLPQRVRQTTFWRSFVSKFSPEIWAIVGLLSSGLIPLIKNMEWLQNLYILLVGLVLILVFVTRYPTCKRYFTLSAGIYLAVYACVRMEIAGILSMARMSILTHLMKWAISFSSLMLVIDHFIVKPTCQQNVSRALGDDPAPQTLQASGMFTCK